MLEGKQLRGIQINFEAVIDMAEITPEELETSLDEVMERLEVLGAPDPAVSASLATGRIEIELSFPGDNAKEILPRAAGMIFEALNGAGFELPDDAFEAFRAQRELLHA